MRLELEAAVVSMNDSHGGELINFALSHASEIAIASLYTCLLLLGTLSNSLIAVAIFRTRLHKTATGKLLANRCVADILVCTTNVVLTPLNSVTFVWSAAQWLCKVLPAWCAANIFASSLTATFVALHRKRSVLEAVSNKEFTKKDDWLARGGIPLIWLASVVMAAPIGFASHVEDPTEVCTEIWDAAILRYLYAAGSSVVQLFVPAMTSIYCYVQIAAKVMEPLRTGSLLCNDSRRCAQIRKKQRVNRLLTLSILSFVLCFLPMNIFNVFLDVSRSLGLTWPHVMEVYHALHIMAMSSVCWNPLFCVLLSERIRDFFLKGTR